MRPPHRERQVAGKRRRGWFWGSGALTRLSFAVLALGLVFMLAVVGDSILHPSPVAAVGPYSFPFTLGKPASPTPWNPSSWDVAVHVRNNYQYGGLDAMQAQHGPDCAPAPATHPVSTYRDAVFLCNNHIMTAMSAGGYGVIYLTPDHMFDWSGGTATLSFPVSTFRTSDRDWIDLWITPFDENLELPLETWLPDLQGPPKDAIHIRMDQFNQGTIFTAETYSNFQGHTLANNWWTTLESLMTPSATIRSSFELDLSQSHLRFGLPLLPAGGSMWWIDTGISVPFTRGVVQLGHHSYTPDKSAGCGPPPEQKALGLGCAPNTWHWGGLSMSSAVPFSLIRANDRVISSTTTTSTTFPVPAPSGSFLRFNGIGTIGVSFDGGATWTTPQIQQESKHAVDHFENYWTPVPPGVTSVRFQGSGWYGGPWLARDLSIMSQNASASGGSSGQPSSNPTSPSGAPAPKPPPPPAPSPTLRTIAGGINTEPSMRPWRYSGPNPDGWWCQPPNCFQNSNPMVTINTELALAHKLGVQVVRMDLPWPFIEPQRGVFDWTRADAIVAAANANGVRLQPVLVYSPSWAASDPTQSPSAQDFKAYVSAVVNRYKTSIHYWEMWNEPDHFHYWNSGEAAYIQNVMVPGYTAAKAADPSAIVILTGTSVWNAGWVDQIYAAGAGSDFDIIAYHDYGGSPQNTATNVLAELNRHGQGSKPIWLGEYGVQESSVSDSQQMALMRQVLLSNAPIAMAEWYNLRDDNSMTCCPPQVAVVGNWGIVMHDDATMKNGFALMQSLLAGTFAPPTPGPTSAPGVPPPSEGQASPSPLPPERSPDPNPVASPSPTPSPRR